MFFEKRHEVAPQDPEPGAMPLDLYPRGRMKPEESKPDPRIFQSTPHDDDFLVPLPRSGVKRLRESGVKGMKWHIKKEHQNAWHQSPEATTIYDSRKSPHEIHIQEQYNPRTKKVENTVRQVSKTDGSVKHLAVKTGPEEAYKALARKGIDHEFKL